MCPFVGEPGHTSPPERELAPTAVLGLGCCTGVESVRRVKAKGPLPVSPACGACAANTWGHTEPLAVSAVLSGHVQGMHAGSRGHRSQVQRSHVPRSQAHRSRAPRSQPGQAGRRVPTSQGPACRAGAHGHLRLVSPPVLQMWLRPASGRLTGGGRRPRCPRRCPRRCRPSPRGPPPSCPFLPQRPRSTRPPGLGRIPPAWRPQEACPRAREARVFKMQARTRQKGAKSLRCPSPLGLQPVTSWAACAGGRAGDPEAPGPHDSSGPSRPHGPLLKGPLYPPALWSHPACPTNIPAGARRPIFLSLRTCALHGSPPEAHASPSNGSYTNNAHSLEN